jgi:riboflavin kinase/FMN adenylyltransferase
MAFFVREGDAPLAEALRGGVIAIGNFDGLHRGHQALIAQAQAQARLEKRPCGILTFEPHPREFFQPQEPLFRLTPPEMKLRLARALGVDFVSVLPFNREFATLSAEEFVSRELVAGLGVAHAVTGYDFHFGQGRKGNPEALRAMGAGLGFGVSIVEQVSDDGGVAPFSSSSIRAQLRQGHVREAASELGYWWRISGTVAQGDQRGRTIGYPTANVVLPLGMAAREGIYATRVSLEGRPGFIHGAAYIGKRPTFDTDRKFLEIYLLDFAQDIYGARMDAEFVEFIRPDQKFDGLDGLLTQMQADCAQVRRVLEGLAASDPMSEFALGRAAAQGLV